MQCLKSGRPLSKAFWVRATLPNWEDMWATLQQEEIKRITKAGSTSGKFKIKKEEEDATLASKGQQGQRGKKKRDLSKVRCFRCGELGHFASTCPQKKGKEDSDSRLQQLRVMMGVMTMWL